MHRQTADAGWAEYRRRRAPRDRRWMGAASGGGGEETGTELLRGVRVRRIACVCARMSRCPGAIACREGKRGDAGVGDNDAYTAGVVAQWDG